MTAERRGAAPIIALNGTNQTRLEYREPLGHGLETVPDPRPTGRQWPFLAKAFTNPGLSVLFSPRGCPRLSEATCPFHFATKKGSRTVLSKVLTMVNSNWTTLLAFAGPGRSKLRVEDASTAIRTECNLVPDKRDKVAWFWKLRESFCVLKNTLRQCMAKPTLA